MATAREPADLLDAFATASDAIFAVDANMGVVFWNKAAERVFGVAAEDAIGQRCDAIVAGFEVSGAPLCVPDCRVVACARKGRASETYDLSRRGADGNRQWLNVSIIVLRGRRRATALAVHIVRDVTERRRIEQAAGATLERLRGGAEGTAAAAAHLTPREAEVLRLLACGASHAEIAATLGISPTTVRNHVERLLAKLGVHSKLEAVVYAARAGLVG